MNVLGEELESRVMVVVLGVCVATVIIGCSFT